jgi:RNA polymerase sigma-70 factor (ECF subfamily)
LQSGLRVVFILRDIEGHSIRDTSGILKLTPAAVKTRLSRARLQLREELSPYFTKRT